MTTERPLQARRILVVEDQYYLATDICDWLTDAGAEVVGPARDVEQARQLLEDGNVDTVVVDINLGTGPTYELAQELSARAVPFVFATGYDEGAIPAQFQGSPRIEKPFNPRDLVTAVQALGSMNSAS